MASRFHIEELISQDSSGVVFRAIDQESGEPVSLRRFFAFGADGSGLQAEERTAYEISIERFGRASHPALRSVLGGGCDPIDGVPFVVTEWIDGGSLSNRLLNGPLPAKQAIEVITRALEVSDVLSQLLAEEAVWVETDVDSIFESAPDTGRGITFWISPLRWLGANEDRRSLKPIIQLTEDLMGWKNQLVSDQAGNGLGTWLKWLKQNFHKTTIGEARETLAAATGGAPAQSTSKLVQQSTRPAAPTARAATPTRPVTPTARAVTSPAARTGVVASPTARTAPAAAKSSTPTAPARQAAAATTAGTRTAAVAPAPQQAPAAPSKLPLILTLVTLLLVFGGGTAWYFIKGEVPLIGKLLPKKVAAVIADEETVPVVDPAAEKETPAGPFFPGDGPVITRFTGKPAIILGVLAQVRDSKNKKALYLEFEKSGPYSYAFGYIDKSGAPADLAAAEMKKLIGKRIRITGIVSEQVIGKDKRPQLTVKDRKSIEVDQ